MRAARRAGDGGSSNLDPFSLLLAREASVFVRDDAFAAEMMGHLRYAIAHQGRRVAADAHACALVPHAHGELAGLRRHAPDDHDRGQALLTGRNDDEQRLFATCLLRRAFAGCGSIEEKRSKMQLDAVSTPAPPSATRCWPRASGSTSLRNSDASLPKGEAAGRIVPTITGADLVQPRLPGAAEGGRGVFPLGLLPADGGRHAPANCA